MFKLFQMFLVECVSGLVYIVPEGVFDSQFVRVQYNVAQSKDLEPDLPHPRRYQVCIFPVAKDENDRSCGVLFAAKFHAPTSTNQMFELGEKVGNPPNIYILPCQYAESDF
jgi:hypothetical protein